MGDGFWEKCVEPSSKKPPLMPVQATGNPLELHLTQRSSLLHFAFLIERFGNLSQALTLSQWHFELPMTSSRHNTWLKQGDHGKYTCSTAAA